MKTRNVKTKENKNKCCTPQKVVIKIDNPCCTPKQQKEQSCC